MFSYVILGINDLEKICVFYNVVLFLLGYGNVVNKDNVLVWSGVGVCFVVLMFVDGDVVIVGNGVIIGFVVLSCVVVNEFYRLVLLVGGIDVGVFGFCDYGFNVYVVYVCDFEGYKIVVSCMSVE